MTVAQGSRIRRHRSAASIGGIAGLALLVGYFAYRSATTPPRPDLREAGAAEIVAYVSHERGLPKIPRIEGLQFFQEWRYVLAELPSKQEELRTCLADLPDDRRKAFSQAIFKHFKRTFLGDARQYQQTAQDQRFAFLEKKVAEYRDQATLVKDVASGFQRQFSGGQDDLQKWIMDHTTAEERALGEPYIDAIKRVREQVRKQQRPAASAPAPGPAPTP